MNHEVQKLLEKANKIVSKTGTKPGTRYPKSLKKIVISLRLDHDMSVRDITRKVGVSSYSARQWPKTIKSKPEFNKVSLSRKIETLVNDKPTLQNYSLILESINFNLKVLIVLITLLIFEAIVLYLI